MPSRDFDRDRLIDLLAEELVGPSRIEAAIEIDTDGSQVFRGWDAARGPFVERGSRQEILIRDAPTKRYGVAVLYPPGSNEVVSESERDEPIAMTLPNAEESSVFGELQDEVRDSLEGLDQEHASADEDLDLSSANLRNPESLGLSLFLELSPSDELQVVVSGARYVPFKVHIELEQEEPEPEEDDEATERKRQWWVRRPLQLTAMFSGDHILQPGDHKVEASEVQKSGDWGPLDLSVQLFSRPDGAGHTLVTAYCVNRTGGPGGGSQNALFQTEFSVSFATNSTGRVIQYPAAPLEAMDDEEKSLELLYSKTLTYAIGHGCAANWDEAKDDASATRVFASPLPVVETPSVSPDILDRDKRQLRVSMAELAGLVPENDGMDSLDHLLSEYKRWIDDRTDEIDDISPAELQDTGLRHLVECRAALDRMEEGLDLLKKDERARLAFRLTNHAMLLSQQHSTRGIREKDEDGQFPARVIYRPAEAPNGKGFWRAFQIAFLLMNLKAIASPTDESREIVDLIWFPTGGGKTEAYLALTAYSTITRRLKEPGDAGTNTLMRYTLRLLTTQQFQRASTLMCALEWLRRNRTDVLGDHAFSIGIWVGRGVTPNRRKQATDLLKALSKNGGRDSEGGFLLNKCPWCGARMGPVSRSEGDGQEVEVIGYVERHGTVVFECEDSSCDFTTGLPVYVIDEDIYANRPDLVIATVDKFAMLPWTPQARALFGLDSSGARLCSPPGLIIQDELHLISGPLGSLAGLYEGVIEELCTVDEDERIRPKIVCSTATVRRSSDQVLGLFGRKDTRLFPPPGLDMGDSFFAVNNRGGKPYKGRKYIGVNAPGLGSIQTAQVRAYTALLQGAALLNEGDRDPWWTLLLFFNSLRELGYGLTLFQSDIRHYTLEYCRRNGIPPESIRNPYNIKELTSRITSDEIPEYMSLLERCYDGTRQTVDACLASNIIEVGIDIDRLSLLSVLGQPKTTAQYIQVTGRVGRDWSKRPGVVVTIYSPGKPRDRSHFEKFRTYHERLYAQVEPTSVTPFSPSALKRALHSVLVAYVRQAGPDAIQPYPPIPDDLLEECASILRSRAKLIGEEEEQALDRWLDVRLGDWTNWKREHWELNRDNPEDEPLLTRAGTPQVIKYPRSWPTMMSMRNVDAECMVQVSKLYDEGGAIDA